MGDAALYAAIAALMAESASKDFGWMRILKLVWSGALILNAAASLALQIIGKVA